ncbi:unnamed protein product [Soboliphyme baturini]|uniref:DNA-binding protein n=1 Tax=Soboliphyme baturini TaxID=241478 RepID=A0A183IL83_9BILA|nr:unnamed protein product [Soboliphyme baturini]
MHGTLRRVRSWRPVVVGKRNTGYRAICRPSPAIIVLDGGFPVIRRTDEQKLMACEHDAVFDKCRSNKFGRNFIDAHRHML